MNVYEYVFRSIHGATMPLGNYRSQPILIVNTASECGYTPQYIALQRMWEDGILVSLARGDTWPSFLTMTTVTVIRLLTPMAK